MRNLDSGDWILVTILQTCFGLLALIVLIIGDGTGYFEARRGTKIGSDAYATIAWVTVTKRDPELRPPLPHCLLWSDQ